MKVLKYEYVEPWMEYEEFGDDVVTDDFEIVSTFPEEGPGFNEGEDWDPFA